MCMIRAVSAPASVEGGYEDIEYHDNGHTGIGHIIQAGFLWTFVELSVLADEEAGSGHDLCDHGDDQGAH